MSLGQLPEIFMVDFYNFHKLWLIDLHNFMVELFNRGSHNFAMYILLFCKILCEKTF